MLVLLVKLKKKCIIYFGKKQNAKDFKTKNILAVYFCARKSKNIYIYI